jgi:hypothetical protein
MNLLKKPKLSLKAYYLFNRIVRYARRYVPDRKYLPMAASDVMDGLCDNKDPAVDELKKKRIIQSVNIGGWTWKLTDEGCEMVSQIPFHPDYVI